MDILIVANNRSLQPMPVIPYGACIVAQAVERAGHRARVIDLMFEPDPVNAVQSAFNGSTQDVVGISVRNLDNNDMLDTAEYITELVNLTGEIRRRTDAPIVLGGPAVGVMPEELLRSTGADFAVLGDGEDVFPRLLEAMENGDHSWQVLQQVPKVALIEGGIFKRSSDLPLQLSPANMFLEFDKWIDVHKYKSNLATVPIQSKRGCPFDCIYCTYGITEGKDYRLFHPEEVADAVSIEFVDNVFNSPYDHAMAICQDLARNPSGANLLTMEMNPAFIDDDILIAMERAGFTGVGVTAESVSDPVLARLAKGYTADHVLKAAEAIRRSPLPCFWIFLIGGPGETRETVMETIQFAKRSIRPMDVAFFNMGIRIYPGTPLERIARDEGILTASPREMLLPAFYFSPELDLKWAREELSRVTGGNINFIHSGSLSHPWLPAINRLGYLFKVKQPLWRHTRTIRRIVRIFGKDIQ
jgi:radical SAM superfamily enzyme YgiQ (UPF0313 family)